MFNWVDLLIIIIFAVYVLDGYRRGFLRLAWELIGLVVAFFFALKFYSGLEHFLQTYLRFSETYARPIAFLFIWIVAQVIFYIAGQYLSLYTPIVLKESKANRYFGLVPAAAKGVIFIAILLILLIVSPVSSELKNTINHSLIGEKLINKIAKIEGDIEKVFAGDNPASSITNTQVQENETKLNFSTTDIKIDEQAEDKMFNMVNLEREKAGVKLLEKNILVRNVARSHGRDMLIRGYFSHNSPTGDTLLTRLNNSHVEFTSAAENIALAPTIDLAQIGLMNSPKHKINILDPTYTEIGIGVIDAGQYGLMVNQDFINN